MILVCGGLADTVTELVCARLQDCGYPYQLLDLATYPEGVDVSWCWSKHGPEGYIAGPDWKLDLNDISGVYVRYVGAEVRMPPPGVATEAVPAMYHEYDTGLMFALEDLPCVVVNRLGGGLSNNSKPYQALLARRSGLRVPPTLVTSDPEEARRFYEDCRGDVIFKSLSGIRSIVRRLGPDQLERLPLLHNGPAQFQAFVPGENIRVHTVGECVFATRVLSEAVDYRYARREGHDVKMEPMELPLGIADACVDIARLLGLTLAGIDFKLTPEGDYYCFEINPSPGFLYYERYSGQPISRALADLLHKGAIIAPPGGKE